MIEPEELFEAFSQAIMKSDIRAKPEDRKRGMELLDYARDDLDSCQVEYENGKYRGSVVFLQQASEKACKSFLSFVGLCEEEDLKRYGHSSDKMSLGVQSKGIHFVHLLVHFDPGSDGVGMDAISNMEREIDEIAVATRESIIEHGTICEQYAVDLLKSIEENLRRAKKSGAKMANVLAASKLATTLVSIMPVFSIAYFASPHAVSARYPGRLGLVDYTPELGIVGAAPELISQLKRAIVTIETNYR